MHLLLISRCPPYPLHLGDRLIPYHLVQQLAGRGHTLDLLAFYDRASDPAEIDHYRDLFRDVQLICAPRRSGLSYLARLIGLARFFPRHAGEAWSPEMWRAAEAKLGALDGAGDADCRSRVGYDVIQAFGGVQVYEYRALCQRAPNVIVPYESYSLLLRRELAQTPTLSMRLLKRLQLLAAQQYERRMFVGYDRVVVLTDVDAAELRRLNPALDVRVIPNGIDLARFSLPDSSRSEPVVQPALLFVGNFEYAPNADAALFLLREIFPRIRAVVPDAHLILVGNAPTLHMQALAGPQVEITGHVPDVQPYLARAAVFISPLRIGAGIKNKVLEAMAMALPLVATPLSGDGIGLREGEHVLYGESAAQLAQAALRLLHDPALRWRMGRANRALIESRFTWERVADQYEALYREIAAKPHTEGKNG